MIFPQKINAMNEKLKEYRKSEGISKKEMAEKLEITIEQYKTIEKGGNIKKSIEKRIRKHLEKERSTAQVKLPRGLADISTHINQMVKFSDPVQKMIDKVNSPLNHAISLSNISGANTSKFTALDYLRDIDSRKKKFNVWGDIPGFSTSVKIATENNLKAYQGLQFVLGNQSSGINSVIDIQKDMLEAISKPSFTVKNIADPTVIQTISERVNRNTIGYQNYIGLSASIMDAITTPKVSSSIYGNFVLADSFINKEKEPSLLDVLSGSSFTIFEEDERFEEELEIIEQIDNDPKLKEQADSFFTELDQIINDESIEEKDEEEIVSIYSRFVQWISTTFGKTEAGAQKIAQNIFKIFPTIIAIIGISVAISGKVQNKEDHRKTQTLIQQGNEEQNKKIAEIENKQKKNTTLLQELLNRENSESSQILIATRDVNLRANRSTKSKIKSIVRTSQKVQVLNKKVKWMEIIYKDAKDGEAKTGWVRIKYFK
ncbi:MAG: hypothetical protein CMC35_09675 [Flavobacteriaceae bacterium]|nr:hypothetical protein [Flavobacteriaceae bacterium]|tara:strand:- start:9334 stop:10794 length:1461 start_codon:yes stop_codon:yes gene_type:complete